MSRPDVKVSAAESGDPMNADCPGRALFILATGKWTLLILWSLRDGPRRFHELRDDVGGISERVLSSTLKALCRHGLTDRHVEPTVPPKVSYNITGTGAGLLSVMQQLTGWIAREYQAVEAAKLRHDQGQHRNEP